MEILLQLFNALPGSVSQGLIWGIMAIGVYITYRILDIPDLTVDGSFATGGAVGVMLILNQSVNVNNTDLLVSLRWVKEFAFHNPLITVGVVLAALIAVLYWFFGTEMGSAIRATGSNLNMSRAQGINTSFNKVLGIMLSNGLVALSGAFLAQYQGFADVKMGQGAIVIGLAAVIIGEALFGKIFRNFALKLFSVALGSIIYYIVIQAVITLGFDANLLKLLSAAIVAIFLAVPYWKRKYNENHVKGSKKGDKMNA